MAMDFFAQQDAARRRTGLLVVYFVLATLLIIASVYCVIAGVTLGVSSSGVASGFWNPWLLMWVAGGTLAVILGGSAYKTAALNSGGASVAEMLGGRRLDPNTSNPQERRLLNVVEEIALASGVPVPSAFLLDSEPGINAFAAGYIPGDAVISVTQGTLDHLTRDELQGVIAHEFSHILNGDMRLNIRLIGLLHGILLIALIGYVLVRSIGRAPRRSRNGKGEGAVFAILVVGAGLIAIGYIGVFFGRLIKSAVSRQREFLADASAVQFTRNPEGIAGALKKIGGLQDGSRIHDGHAEEASHLFFGNALGSPLWSLLATHPTLTARIQRIDPSFDGQFPVVEPITSRTEPEGATVPAAARVGIFPGQPTMLPGVSVGRLPIDPAGVLALIGNVEAKHLKHAAALMESLPEELRAASRQQQGAQALIYSLLLDEHPDAREVQRRYLRENVAREIQDRMQQLAQVLARLPATTRLPLIDLTFPILRTLSPDEYRRFRESIAAIVRADSRLALFEYTVRRMLMRHLDGHFAQRKPPIAQYYSLRPLLADCDTLLSSLAHVGQTDASDTARAFQSAIGVLRADDDGVIALRPREQCGLKAVDQSLMRLAVASPQIKKRLLTAALACVVSDGCVKLPEVELLRAIADALDCPMPPLVAE